MTDIYDQVGKIFLTPSPASEKSDDEEIGATDMPELESEESAEQRKKYEGKRLKILTPEHKLSRVLTSLAQLKAENTSQKLK